MRFLSKPQVRERFEGKTVAIVGSGPGCLDNEKGFIESHDVVVRVNNYRLSRETGYRTDVFYSFFGSSIRKTAAELLCDGVTLCMCKCPDAYAIESAWHVRHNKMLGVDFRHIYRRRKDWWFCDTYVPSTEDFLITFDLLGKHVPTTGFSAIQDILSLDPMAVYLTGFDFFRSGLHNVNEPWRRGNPSDPIGHVPERELAWIVENAGRLPITVDNALRKAMSEGGAVAA